MNDTDVQSRPTTVQTVGRLIAGLLLMVGPLIVVKRAVLPVLGLRSGAPPTDAIRSHPVEFFVTVTLTLATTVIGYWVSVRWLERRPVRELALHGRSAMIGVISGAILIGLPMGVLYASGYYTLQEVGGLHREALAITLVVGSIVLLEELVFRGLLFGVLERAYGAPIALVVQAIAFSLAHVPNDNWSGAMPLISTFLIGLLWGAFYLIYQNIWAIALHHAAWNLTIFAAGLPLSGITEWRPFAPLRSTLSGPELLTGGLGGPELSVLTPLLVVATLGLMLLLSRRSSGRLLSTEMS